VARRYVSIHAQLGGRTGRRASRRRVGYSTNAPGGAARRSAFRRRSPRRCRTADPPRTFTLPRRWCATLDAGINFFDTADVYGEGESEAFVGKALGDRRNEVLIATKFGYAKGGKPEYVKQAVEDSLRRLATDRIDLYQYHRPDPNTPIEDTLGAMQDLVRAGKVREIGCSNFSAEHLRIAQNASTPSSPRFVSVQNEYSLIRRDPEAAVLPECERLGIAFIPYFPLASGLLTGKYRRGQPLPPGSRGDSQWGPKVFTDENLALVERLIAFAGSRGRSLLELAMSWLASRPAVASVIAGATKPEQVKSNAAAVDWQLTGADQAEIDSILKTVQV
jgi:aryl-alcohol dehydrogenase-like predicted oxidoreductase